VNNLTAPVFAQPNTNGPVLHHLGFGSQLVIVNERGDFAELASGGFTPLPLLSRLDFAAEDTVAEAFRFLGVPVVFGGRSPMGVDAPGLVQLIHQSCNYNCPRDLDMQERDMGKAIDR